MGIIFYVDKIVFVVLNGLLPVCRARNRFFFGGADHKLFGNGLNWGNVDVVGLFVFDLVVVVNLVN